MNHTKIKPGMILSCKKGMCVGLYSDIYCMDWLDYKSITDDVSFVVLSVVTKRKHKRNITISYKVLTTNGYTGFIHSSMAQEIQKTRIG